MKFLPKPWQLFVVPRWERGRPVRNRGRRPLERPPAALGRARRPRSQGEFKISDLSFDAETLPSGSTTTSYYPSVRRWGKREFVLVSLW